MKSFKTQLLVALIAVLAVGAFTMGCNKSDTDSAGDKMKDAAAATHDAATNAMGSMTSTNK